MNRRPRATIASAIAALVVAVLGLAACGSSSPPSGRHSPLSGGATPSTPASATPSGGATPPAGAATRPDHILVAIFENKAYSQVIGKAPAFDAMVASGTSYTNSRAITHPSQPNYLALFSGSTQGVPDDSCPHTFSTGNLGQQLIDAKLSFTGFAEGLPHSGFTGCSAGNYARKHAPWVNFANLPGPVSRPYAAFPSDYSKLPSVAFVVPDLCNDMHDCPVSAGDAWLGKNLTPYASWARTHNSLLIVTFDEDNGSARNVIPTIVVGAGIPVSQVSSRIDQYSVLRAIENCFGLPALGSAAHARSAPRLC